ncbi:bsl2086 [Bradyrhizobium diazoefficiens USDA 110]|uniref:Bsl2086 protein n=2 Tax=Bradyrhizobium TaxID=374 RepID=Q89TD6_BRADU|nr:hypothetical protein RN69_37715 [Bradyrhizobium japonicum]AND87626.1 hypothetical protein AAV28_07260 [Bradyrhizobium diazoefficiens USDA 110]PDT56259.1 hypothetical protein CO678_39375 [Bradyrhizobium diazoefficiens]BAL13014.1 hypothetical protein BJ6T_77690 [Bradyrhizobium japonicum USDA 6]KGT75155.1 hypothetical protein MA20_35060 [Bradyrhizobium japonicum]
MKSALDESAREHRSISNIFEATSPFRTVFPPVEAARLPVAKVRPAHRALRPMTPR